MLKRSALAGSVVLLGFLVAASCGDSSDSTGDKGGGNPNAGEGGEAASGGTGGNTGGTAGSSTSGAGGEGATSGTGTGGTSGESGGGGDAGAGNAGGEGGEGATGGTMAGSGGMGKAGMGGKGGMGGSGGAGITCPTAADFEESWAQHICAKNSDCCSSDEVACRAAAQTGILQLYPSLVDSVMAGTAEINCDNFVACMTAINNASCTDWPKELATDFGLPVAEAKCRAIIQGKITSGAGTGGNACTQNYQCVNGFCRDPDAGGAQIQQCIAFQGTGLVCSATSVCNPVTHFCDDPDGDGTGTCAARKANTATCTAANQCESRSCSTTCVPPAKPAQCQWIPTPPAACSVARVGSHKSSLGWLAVAGAAIGFAGMRRRRRQ